MIERSIQPFIARDLDTKIVLLSGPRQVGKTYLSRSYFPDAQNYLNFDQVRDRALIRKQAWDRDKQIVIFDEIHKWRSWKSWIKGVYDTEGVRPRILVTGSARLDVFRKGGDSLAGRHFSFRLHPFSLRELQAANPAEALDTMMRTGGFPEPFLKGTEADYLRWQRGHLDRILREDLLDLENVRNLKGLELLVDLLAERVGSTISYASLARDLEVSPHTIKHWIEILERLYVIFVVTPYSKRLAKGLLKEPKIYFYDTGRVQGGDGGRFENLIACHLLKRSHYIEDTQGIRSDLHYVRDREKREVDFLTLRKSSPELLVEAKLSDDQPSPHLKYFMERLQPVQSLQVVKNIRRETAYSGIRVRDAARWLSELET